MFSKTNKLLFYRAWLRLIVAYLLAFALSFGIGFVLIQFFKVSPETIFGFSTKRISIAFPVFTTGTELGVDLGIILFFWNTLASVITISFLYTAPLFNPQNILLSPRLIRKILCGSGRMKLLCFLPGCLAIEAESIRRVYVWLMVPWLGMTLLGIESGLTASTSAFAFGSYLIGFVSLLPHGIVEIPSVAFAGAVTFTMHLMVKKKAGNTSSDTLFAEIETFKKEVPLVRIVLIVMAFLFIAGLIEGHITPLILDFLAS